VQQRSWIKITFNGFFTMQQKWNVHVICNKTSVNMHVKDAKR